MTTNSLYTGRKSSIGPSGVPIFDRDVLASEGIVIYADVLNTNYVWIGNSGFTVNSADLTDGFPLGSGDSVFLQSRHPENIYVQSPSSGQKLWWMVQ